MRRETGHPDDSWDDMERAAGQGYGQARAAGKTPEEALAIMFGAVAHATDAVAPEVASGLIKTAPKMMRSRNRNKRGFERRLRKYWGDALDLYYIVAVCAEETGATFHSGWISSGVEYQDYLFLALGQLHARACRTAFEVHHLLSGGFALGALARSRTLHELAVTATILGNRGLTAPNLDLAERYLLHHTILNLQDARVYQENYQQLGYEPLTDEEYSEMQDRRDRLVVRFGTPFKRENGWAAQLLGSDRVSFMNLEALAELSHLRGHYKWASHEVHADSKGTAMNQLDQGGQRYLSSGPSNAGLADPGQMALTSLYQVMVQFLLSTDPSPKHQLECRTVEHLVDTASGSFIKAHNEVEAAEARLIHRLAVDDAPDPEWT